MSPRHINSITTVHRVVRLIAAGDQFADLLPRIEFNHENGDWDKQGDIVTGARLVAIGLNNRRLLDELNSLEHWIEDQRKAITEAAEAETAKAEAKAEVAS